MVDRAVGRVTVFVRWLDLDDLLLAKGIGSFLLRILSRSIRVSCTSFHLQSNKDLKGSLGGREAFPVL